MSGLKDNVEMPKQRDSNTGLYTERYPRSAFIDALEALGGATTQEVADTVGCARDTAYKKLRHLDENGEIASRTIGSARFWTINKEDDS